MKNPMALLGLFDDFPRSHNREFPNGEQGILDQEQGIEEREIKGLSFRPRSRP